MHPLIFSVLVVMDFLRKISLILVLANDSNENKRMLYFLSHPEYCTRYYRCSHGIDEVFECPRGTAWDDVTKSCAWVEQVDCQDKKLGYSTRTTTEGMKNSSLRLHAI